MSEEDHSQNTKAKVTLSLFSFVMITSAALLSIRTFPAQALMGWQSVSFNIMAIVMYLIPAALVAAELASGWPGEGGVYEWVREAFGEKWGFSAVWLQWFQMTIGFISILAFIAAGVAYLFMPALAASKWFIFLVILVIWWGATWVNMKGMKTYTRYTTLFAILGTYIPMIVLVVGCVVYLLAGHHPFIPYVPTWESLIPNFSSANDLVLLVTFVFFYIGIEVTAAHVNNMKNPSRDYPLAILIVSIVMAIISIVGGVLLAWIIPAKNMSLNAGIMQAYQVIFGSNLGWLVSVMAFLIVIGAVGQVLAWVLGPIRGLGVTARHGTLPPMLQKMNKEGVPTGLMVAQGIFISFWGLVFLVMPGDVNSSFWALFALTTTVYIVMYFLMYAAAIKLRYSHPDTPRKFKVPGGKIGMWVMSGWGFICMVFVFVLSLLPPSQVQENPLPFELFMIIGTIVVSVIPLIIYRFRKVTWSSRGGGQGGTVTSDFKSPTGSGGSPAKHP